MGRLMTSIALLIAPMLCLSDLTSAAGPLDDEGRLVRFDRDVMPIFRDHCLECHGPDDAKADFRIDDRELVLGYIEPGDPEFSTLYFDYMIAEDEDMLMPPPNHDNPLSPGQLALVQTWINEGADWPADVAIEPLGVTPAEATTTVVRQPQTLFARLWSFQGFFHPATVHFPIALLMVGALFVVLGLKWKTIGTQVPAACLILGAASGVVASLMGWSFADEIGYGSLFDPAKEIFWHRWSGIIVAVLSVVLALLAIRGLRTGSRKLNGTWKAGLVVVGLMSGLVGHQGGELHYGADFYDKAFEKLLGDKDSVDITDPATAAADTESGTGET